MFDLRNVDCLEGLKDFRGKDGYVIVTDPPFNVGYHYANYSDNLKDADYIKWMGDVLQDFPFVLIHYPESIYKILFYLQRLPNKLVSWVYNANTPKQHRDIAYVGIEPDLNRIKQPYKNPTDKRIQERIKNGSQGARLYDWWEISQVKNVSKDKTSHPCQMPLEVMRRAVGIIPDSYTIIDPFMGSGTTGVACKMLGRDFVGFELDKTYFDIAKERIENYGRTEP